MTRLDAAARLATRLNPTLTEVTSNIHNLPAFRTTYPLAGGFLVVNGIGGIAMSRRLWLCQCHQCGNLGSLLQPEKQIILSSTSLRALWLVFSLEEVKGLELGSGNEVEADFRSVACATPFTDRNHLSQGMCAYLPDQHLSKMYDSSRLRLRNNGCELKELLLDETGICAHAFCASLTGPASEAQLSRSVTVTSGMVEGQDHGPLGVICYGWDESRAGVDSSSKVIIADLERSTCDADGG